MEDAFILNVGKAFITPEPVQIENRIKYTDIQIEFE